ncbi:MAG: AAA family ATPase [Paludibacteraceae bacterium]|nr:AAA family ATPase [Paludibacteraceae bacterium]
MYKVGIIGPECTGKSTLARYLAKRYGGIYVAEYAREYVERKGTTEVSKADIDTIATQLIKTMQGLEDKLYFFDTEFIYLKVWYDYAFGKVPSWEEEALRKYKMDVYLLAYPDIPWEADTARSNGSDAIRMELFERYQAEIEALGTPYYIIKHE